LSGIELGGLNDLWVIEFTYVLDLSLFCKTLNRIKKHHMAKNLVIVESPAKAKTIEKYLGKDYIVKSSIGHIRDLPGSSMGIDIDGDFEPEYVVSPDKKKTVKELKDLAKKAEKVLLATDEDREGEAIAWHLAKALDLDVATTDRIVFHEITKNAILRAIEKPRKIDQNLVNAQQARRVLDRLVGFEISPVLWRKIKTGLSAGRVQSVSVRLIVEREREIMDFKPESWFRVRANFANADKHAFRAELNHRVTEFDSAEELLTSLKGASYKVAKVEKKPGKRSPAAPFTTSTLQQEAARKLGFSVSQTMTLAQRLYENGLITYMRTDSVNLSKEAVAAAADEVKKDFGEEYSQPRMFKSKSKGAQEAHEAIRPTSISRRNAGADAQQKRLYDLIWKRTIASQMAEAKLERTTIDIENDKTADIFQAKGEVIVFDGFLKVYFESTDDEPEEQDGMLPAVREGENLKNLDVEAVQRFSKHPPRFTEASLVKQLEDLGIGRPSTYAPTISTIQNRKYVEKTSKEGEERKYHVLALVNDELKTSMQSEITGAEKNKLFPTDIGMVVNDYLMDQFDEIMDFHFTARVEEEFDDIAQGQREWNRMIREFYKDFHPKVKEASEEKGRRAGERYLGDHPKSGKPVYAKIGRYGSMVQIGSAEDDEKPEFASLMKDQQIGTITLEEALELFKLPRTVGEYKGKEVVAGVGRFGPYVRYDGMFVSIKGHDPLSINMEDSVVLIEEKIEQEKNKYINVFDDADPKIEVLNGRYGPYIKQGKKNYKIPKGEKPEELTLEQCLEIIEKAPKTKSRARKKK
jgi:DNA topoisomerase-1